MKISLTFLRQFDPTSAGVRFCCPLEGCTDKARDAAHRSLRVDPRSGKYFCHRCGGKGVVLEHSQDRRPSATVSAIFSARPARRTETIATVDHTAVVGRQVERLKKIVDYMRDDDIPYAEEILSATTLIEAAWEECR